MRVWSKYGTLTQTSVQDFFRFLKARVRLLFVERLRCSCLVIINIYLSVLLHRNKIETFGTKRIQYFKHWLQGLGGFVG